MKHTGKIHHGKHGRKHMKAKKGHDKMAHASHKAANQEHGMGKGLAAGHCYEGGAYEGGGAPTMESNTVSHD